MTTRRTKSQVTLVLGGARSGKSTLALRLAGAWRRPVFVATAEALDDEMTARIAAHRGDRPPKWRCVEEPVDIVRVLRRPPAGCDGVLVDCLTFWLTNVLLKEGERAVARRVRDLCAALRHPACDVILVSNEVGMGIVPEHRLGRDFRDQAGRMDQQIAARADTVIFAVAGLPMVLKGQRAGRKGV